MQGLPAAVMADWTSFHTACSEVGQSAAMQGGLRPFNVVMYRVLIDSEAAQQAAMANGSGPPPPPFGPVNLPPISTGNPVCWSGEYTGARCCDVTNGPTGDMQCWSGSFNFEFCCPAPVSPAPSPGGSASTELEQYHAQCTTANILTCVPACNATTHGYELLATIDGTDTKFSCALANLLFSWVGAAALGGYLGRNVAAFVSAVISGAAGTYVLTFDGDADVGADLVVQPGQNVIISGNADLVEAPSWGTGGFSVQQFGSLSLTNICLTRTSLRFTMANFGSGGLLILDGVAIVGVPGQVTLIGTAMGGTGTELPVLNPPDLQLTSFFPAHFVVLSGPCTLAEGGRCVGRWPGGYLSDEDCEIVGAADGVLGDCPVFDVDHHDSPADTDYLTLPDGTRYSGVDCPTGAVLTADQSLAWHSDGDTQGGHGNGLDVAVHGEAGGGWQICFA